MNLTTDGSLGRFLGFWATLTRAAFGYVGCENVALAAGETRDPKSELRRKEAEEKSSDDRLDGQGYPPSLDPYRCLLLYNGLCHDPRHALL